jgi:cytochrome c oxidase assembly protein subunit 15
VALGITTLLTHVPVPLGAAHQGGAMVLFTLMLGLLYSIRPGPSLGTFRCACVCGGGATKQQRAQRRAVPKAEEARLRGCSPPSCMHA